MRPSTALILLALLAASASPARADLWAVVTNTGSNTVSVIDVATGTVINTIAVGTGPIGIAADRRLNRVFIANSASASLTRINLANDFVDSISMPGSLPEAVGVADKGDLVVVSSMEFVSVPPGSAGRVYILGAGEGGLTLDGSILVEDDPEGIVVFEESNDFWFASDLKVQEVDLTALPIEAVDVISGVEGTDDYEHVAVRVDKAVLFATNAAANVVEVISLSTETILASVATGNDPEFVATRPGSNDVYVSNQAGASITVFSGVTPYGVIGTVTLTGATPKGIAFLPDGSEAWVAMAGSGRIIRINTTTRTEIAPILVGTAPEEIVILDVPTGAELVNDPGTLTFASRLVGGAPLVKPFDLTNAGRSVATVSGYTITGIDAADFTAPSGALPTIAPGQTVTLNVSFAPSDAGPRSATLSIASNDLLGPATLTLIGTGSPLAARDWSVFE